MAYRHSTQQPATLGTRRHNPFTGDQLHGEFNQHGEALGSSDPMFPKGGGSNLDAGVFAPRTLPGGPPPIARSPMAPIPRPTGVGPASGLRTGTLRTGTLAPASPVGFPAPAPTSAPKFLSGPNLPLPAGIPNPTATPDFSASPTALPSVRGVMIDPKYQTPGASPIGVISGGTVSDASGAKYDPASGQTFPGKPAPSPIRSGAGFVGAFPPVPGGPPLPGSTPLPAPKGAPARPGFGDLKMAENASPAQYSGTAGAVVTPPLKVQSPGLALNPPPVMGFDPRSGTGGEAGVTPKTSLFGAAADVPPSAEGSASRVAQSFPRQAIPPIGGEAGAGYQVVRPGLFPRPPSPTANAAAPTATAATDEKRKRGFPGMLSTGY